MEKIDALGYFAKCPFCKEWFTKKGISNHISVKHKEKYGEFEEKYKEKLTERR